MKGLLAPVLVITMTGMVMGQTNTFPTEPIAYSLPVSDTVIDSLKVEGWRQADIEPGLETWIWQIILRNPKLGPTPEPLELGQHSGIRAGKIYFHVNEEQLATIHQQGLVYTLQAAERGQFTQVVLVYESQNATVPLSQEQSELILPAPPANLALPEPPNDQLGLPPVDLTSRTNHPKPTQNTATSQQDLERIIQENRAEAARLSQLRQDLNLQQQAITNQRTDENRPPINYPTNQFPNQYSNATVQYSVESEAADGTNAIAAPVSYLANSNHLQPTAMDQTSTSATAAENVNANDVEGTHKTNGLLWFSLFCAIGLNVYLGWISRGFYVRYGELADELKETFSASL